MKRVIDVALQRDTMVWPDLYIYQHQKGYHFNRDSVVLARSLPDLSGKNCVDLGCGSGVIALLILREHQERSVKTRDLPYFDGFEVQSSLSDVCRYNIKANGLEAHFGVQTDGCP